MQTTEQTQTSVEERSVDSVISRVGGDSALRKRRFSRERYLRYNEKIFSFYSTIVHLVPNRRAHVFLIFVDERSVNVAVASVNGVLD